MTRGDVWWPFATATYLHRIRRSPFADIFSLLVSRELTHGKSDILLPRQPVSIGSDGDGLFTNVYFHPVRNSILCCISLSRTDFRWVWLFMALVHRTQFGCIGQRSTNVSNLPVFALNGYIFRRLKDFYEFLSIISPIFQDSSFFLSFPSKCCVGNWRKAGENWSPYACQTFDCCYS